MLFSLNSDFKKTKTLDIKSDSKTKDKKLSSTASNSADNSEFKVLAIISQRLSN